MRKIRRYGTVNGERKRYSHIIWHAHTGHWPKYPDEIIHHIDGDSLNDSFENLQIMSHAEHTSLHQTGRINSEEANAQMSASKKGKPRSCETRAKISTALIEQWTDLEFRNNRIEAMNRLDVKTKQSAANMGKNNPMYGMTGEDCPNWKGATASDHAKYMREWRARKKEQEIQLNA